MVKFRRVAFVFAALSSVIFVSAGVVSCAWVKASGTITKGAGQGMTEAASHQEDQSSFLSKILRFGGKVNTAVGGAVEGAADDEKSRESGKPASAAKPAPTRAQPASGSAKKSTSQVAPTKVVPTEGPGSKRSVGTEPQQHQTKDKARSPVDF